MCELSSELNWTNYNINPYNAEIFCINHEDQKVKFEIIKHVIGLCPLQIF